MYRRPTLATLVPALGVLFGVVMAAVPWGLPHHATFILPLVTMALIFSGAARFHVPMPAWLAFLAGLTMDMLTAGPLGYWSLIFLLAHSLARLNQRFNPGAGALELWLAFAVAAALVVAFGWGLASLYFVRVIDGWPMAAGVGVAVAAFPLVDALLAWLCRTRTLAGGGRVFGG